MRVEGSGARVESSGFRIYQRGGMSWKRLGEEESELVWRGVCRVPGIGLSFKTSDFGFQKPQIFGFQI